MKNLTRRKPRKSQDTQERRTSESPLLCRTSNPERNLNRTRIKRTIDLKFGTNRSKPRSRCDLCKGELTLRRTWGVLSSDHRKERGIPSASNPSNGVRSSRCWERRLGEGKGEKGPGERGMEGVESSRPRHGEGRCHALGLTRVVPSVSSPAPWSETVAHAVF